MSIVLSSLKYLADARNSQEKKNDYGGKCENRSPTAKLPREEISECS